MKLYECHQRVRAARIVGIEDILAGRNDKTCTLRLDDGSAIQVDFGWTWRHDARIGNYLVQYDDGNLSCWQPDTFAAGYKPVEGQ